MSLFAHISTTAALMVLVACFCSATAQEQPKALAKKRTVTDTGSLHTFRKGSVLGTLSLGFGDEQRSSYSVPAGYAMDNVTGFAPLYGRLEYGVSRSVSLGIALVYDGYNAGFARLYESNGQTYKRHYNDFVKVFSGSLFAAWHFGKLTGSKKLDPFVTLGIGTNNISHSSKPMADSIGSAKEYSSSLFLRAGVRYYVSRRGSLFADLGIDNKAIATVGFSCSLEK